MKLLQEGTEFYLIDCADKTNTYRKVIIQNGYYRVVDYQGDIVCFSNKFTLEELNKYYCNHDTWKIEIISQPQFQLVDNSKLKEVSFNEAMTYYKRGKTIECRILNEQGAIIDWEKYHLCEGLEICLEFNEILYGKWYVEA